MPYPPIPRDPSGTPLPVIWDDATKNWKVYEGVKYLVGPDGQPLMTAERPGIVQLMESVTEGDEL